MLSGADRSAVRAPGARPESARSPPTAPHVAVTICLSGRRGCRFIPSVRGERPASLDGRDGLGGVIDSVHGEGGRVGPDQLGMLTGLPVYRLPVPAAGFEEEP